MAATEAGKELIWLTQLFGELGERADASKLLLDSQSAIKLAKNPVFHRRTKHIDVKYHKIREWVKNSAFTLEYVSTKQMAADFLTKNVNSKILERSRALVGITKEPKEEGN